MSTRLAARRLVIWLACVQTVASTPAVALAEPSVGENRAQEPENETGAVPRLEDEEEKVLPGRDARLLSATLSLGGARDRREREGAAEIEDEIYVVGADLRLGGQLTERTELVVEYQPEYERFAERSESDTLHHLAETRLEYRLSRRWSVGAAGSLVDSDDPGRFLDDELLLLPRTPYRQVGGRGGLEYQARFTSVRFEAGYVSTRIEPSTGIFAAGLDQIEEIAALAVDRAMGPRSTLFASASYVQPDSRPLLAADVTGSDTASAALDEPLATLALGWRYQPSQPLSVTLSGGVLDDGLELSWIGAAELARQGANTAFRLRYDRAAASVGGSFAGGGAATPGTALVPGGVTDAASLVFEIGTGNRWRWIQEARAARTTFRDAERLETLTASTMFLVRTVAAVDLYLALDYGDQRGGSLPGESRLRTSIGVRVGLPGSTIEPGVLGEPRRATGPGNRTES